MTTVTATPVDPAFVASLPGCDFADAFSVTVPRRDLDARVLSAEFFSTPPAWAGALMDLRNAIMGRLGYKAPRIRQGFPVLRESTDEVVSGLNDRHLDFRALMKVEPVGTGDSRITLTTAVATHNRIGRAYLVLIMPFHRLIVRSMVQQMAARLAKDALA